MDVLAIIISGIAGAVAWLCQTTIMLRELPHGLACGQTMAPPVPNCATRPTKLGRWVA